MHKCRPLDLSRFNETISTQRKFNPTSAFNGAFKPSNREPYQKPNQPYNVGLHQGPNLQAKPILEPYLRSPDRPSLLKRRLLEANSSYVPKLPTYTSCYTSYTAQQCSPFNALTSHPAAGCGYPTTFSPSLSSKCRGSCCLQDSMGKGKDMFLTEIPTLKSIKTLTNKDEFIRSTLDSARRSNTLRNVKSSVVDLTEDPNAEQRREFVNYYSSYKTGDDWRPLMMDATRTTGTLVDSQTNPTENECEPFQAIAKEGTKAYGDVLTIRGSKENGIKSVKTNVSKEENGAIKKVPVKEVMQSCRTCKDKIKERSKDTLKGQTNVDSRTKLKENEREPFQATAEDGANAYGDVQTKRGSKENGIKTNVSKEEKMTGAIKKVSVKEVVQSCRTFKDIIKERSKDTLKGQTNVRRVEEVAKPNGQKKSRCNTHASTFGSFFDILRHEDWIKEDMETWTSTTWNMDINPIGADVFKKETAKAEIAVNVENYENETDRGTVEVTEDIANICTPNDVKILEQIKTGRFNNDTDELYNMANIYNDNRETSTMELAEFVIKTSNTSIKSSDNLESPVKGAVKYENTQVINTDIADDRTEESTREFPESGSKTITQNSKSLTITKEASFVPDSKNDEDMFSCPQMSNHGDKKSKLSSPPSKHRESSSSSTETITEFTITDNTITDDEKEIWCRDMTETNKLFKKTVDGRISHLSFAIPSESDSTIFSLDQLNLSYKTINNMTAYENVGSNVCQKNSRGEFITPAKEGITFNKTSSKDGIQKSPSIDSASNAAVDLKSSLLDNLDFSDAASYHSLLNRLHTTLAFRSAAPSRWVSNESLVSRSLNYLAPHNIHYRSDKPYEAITEDFKSAKDIGSVVFTSNMIGSGDMGMGANRKEI